MNSASTPAEAVLRIAARVHNLAIAAGEPALPHSRWCPCCGWRGLRFRTFVTPEYLRRNAICPRCGALERHRALSRFYPSFFTKLDRRPERMIHFAPEPCLRPTLARLADRYETSGWGESYAADHRLDLTRLDLAAAACDAFVLNHVLDVVADDRTAVRELFRALRPGGVVLVVATLELGVPSRDVPRRQNGLCHVFGTADLAERFAPFAVSIADAAADIAPGERRLASLPRTVPVIVLRKPNGATP